MPNTWYHLAISFDGNNLNLYQNGQNVATVTPNCAFTHTGTNLCIGSYNCGGELFNGLIDEVLIYNRTLSSTEIRNLYLYG